MSEQVNWLPLIAAQPGIWMADQLSPHSNAYAVAHVVELTGHISLAHLITAIKLGLTEADTLHMVFRETEGEAVQGQGNAPLIAPEYIDLRQQTDPYLAADTLIQQDLHSDLRLAAGKPLYRHLILQVADHHWRWYQRYHHIAIDGFSFTALTKRIADIYTACCQSAPAGPSPFIPFSEVVSEYLDYRQSVAWQRDAGYWQEKVAALPPAVTLSEQPLAGQIPATRLLRHHLTLSAAELQPVTGQLAAKQLTLTDGAIALIAVWLARLTGQQPFSCGFIFMRRLGSAALCATGPVINVLPMAVDYDPDLTLTELANRLTKEVKRNRRHQRYDAEQVMRDAGRHGDNDPLYGPVINVKMFDYQLCFNGLPAETRHLASGPVRDLEIALYPGENGELTVELLANAERYDAGQLQEHLERLPLLAEQFGRSAGLKCSEALILNRHEQQQIAEINQTDHSLPAETLYSLLAQQAQSTPQAIALADIHRQLDYREMHQQVLALAQQLLAAGVRHGDIVAVALPRSVYLSLALQAIVRLGAIWLPLDTGYPDDRLQLMLEDAGPKLLITEAGLAARFQAITDVARYHYQSLLPALTVPLKATEPAPGDGAYLIYTSGSTGRPKGVLVGHQAIVNRLLWMQNHYALAASDVVLQKTPASFDVSVWEFFWPLITGARLMMAPPESHREPDILLQLILDYQVTVLHFVPSMLAAFTASLDSETAAQTGKQLRRVFCSGEALPASLARQWQTLCGTELHNLYGPTEAAVDVSGYPAFGDALAAVTGNSVPIGFPVWNTGLHILDNRLQPVPPGIAGELWLSGVQLAEGYLGRPGLTATRFVALPGKHGERMYRTGDVVRRLEKGAIEYLGRNDDQLKIRGQRIELTEIDHLLQGLAGIRQAVTVARVLQPPRHGSQAGWEDARQLISYVISDQPTDSEQLRAELSAHLPAHMVPIVIMQVDDFPLSSNGKLDRKALPLPETGAGKIQRLPEPGLESTLATEFAAILGCDQVYASDDFFALGGHSLLAMRLAARLRQVLAIPVTVGQIMIAPGVEALARLLTAPTENTTEAAGFSDLLPLREAGGPELFCFHPASGFAWQFSILRRYLDPHWQITGIQSPAVQGVLNNSQHIDEVCEAHLQRLRQRQPHGPYYLLGYSLGGTLAQGVAARLEAAGEQVAFLGLLDTWPPETQNWDERQGKNVLDPEVLAEVDREREQFMQSQRTMAGEEMSEMFDVISANYASAVRLLTTAGSAKFGGNAVMFLAEKTRQPGMDARQCWAPYLPQLQIVPLNCAHSEILSDKVFTRLGPAINQYLKASAP
ncbi:MULTISPECIES: enterobactin synthase subunit F [Tatumella]|uniref:Enterobactin synthase subunit F n=1 Tax=Tatumella punctata TaxID=399969 RepID=A0ABW1VN40_9GAMM|nr:MULTISPECIES: enterobactin synthase subunit F [unclassified Tatumella]MBS0856413.1 enterobactin synthase subunit F [Tatumella sp. JGM16]MBS0912563.1 enterobactin synthase subunit F [Tatumella sp. JGM91]